MQGRRYSREVMWARFAIARDWLRRFPELGTATHHDVERWLIERDVSPAATRNLLTNLRALYRWALREQLVTTDPTLLVDRPRVPMRLPRPAAERQIGYVVSGADERLRALVALMACGGLRCVECSRLNWSDVDFAAGTLIVMGKGERERLLSASPDVMRALAALRLATRGSGEAVFVGRAGRLSPARVSQIVCRAFRELGYPTVAHQLRHRCATRALELPDVRLEHVRELLGHASIATTQVYTAVAPERTAATSRALRLPDVAA